MKIVDRISITELSRLTKKSRPTLYKYIDNYENNNLNDVPYSFIVLFQEIEEGASKRQIEDLCFKTFGEEDEKVSQVIQLIKEHKDEIDFDKLMTILEGLTNGK